MERNDSPDIPSLDRLQFELEEAMRKSQDLEQPEGRRLQWEARARLAWVGYFAVVNTTSLLPEMSLPDSTHHSVD